MTNPFKDIHNQLAARQNAIVKAYGNNPNLATLEGKLALVIDQLDTLTAITALTIKELGDAFEQNRRN